MVTSTKRILRNQQKGRRQRQRLTHTYSTSKQSKTTCTSIDMSTLPFIATAPPLLLPVITTPSQKSRPHAHTARSSVKSTPNVISPVHTGKRVKGYVRPPPSKQETTDNLEPTILASLSAPKDSYKSNLSDFERNHNVHRPPDDIPTGHEIEQQSYRFHHGTLWTKDEEDVLYNAIKYVAQNPLQRKKGEKRLSFWKRVQIEMSSSRTTEALSSHFSGIINNKMKEQHPRFGDFIKLKQLIDNSKVAESDSSRKATLNRYTAMLDMKEKSKAERKREKEAKQEQMDENINAICNLLQTEIEHPKQESHPNDESESQWRRRNIMEIRNGLDLIAANKENTVLAKDVEKLQVALLHKDGAESIIIEYERLKQKQLSTTQIISKLIELARLMK